MKNYFPFLNKDGEVKLANVRQPNSRTKISLAYSGKNVKATIYYDSEELYYTMKEFYAPTWDNALLRATHEVAAKVYAQPSFKATSISSLFGDTQQNDLTSRSAFFHMQGPPKSV